VYTKADIYFTTSIALKELKLKLSTKALYTKAAVAVDVVSES
jgi:hypothetical protein